MNFRFEHSGRFRIEAVSPRGRRILADWFPNLITNAGLNFLRTSSTYLQGCHVGAGNATPAVTDTSLQSFVAGTTTRVSNTGGVESSLPRYTWRRITYRFGIGVATGNLSEVAITQGSSGTGAGGAGNPSAALFARALILDNDSNPTTITVLADEILDVTYEFRVYPPEADITVGTVIAGENFIITGRPGSVTSGSVSTGGWSIGTTGSTWTWLSTGSGNGASGAILSAVTAGLSAPSETGNTFTNNISLTTDTYIADSYYTQVNLTINPPGANFTDGLRAIAIQFNIGQIKFGYESQDTPGRGVNKHSTNNFLTTFRITWARR